jgi:putative transposase
VASAARPDTILAWFRKLVAQTFDGSRHRLCPGRPPVGPDITELIVRMARENSGRGYDRIAGALRNLAHRVPGQTMGNILHRFGIAPAPSRRRQMSWADFIRSHMAVLTGIDFFTAEVLTWRGLATYYVLFFLRLETRRVTLAGITQHPTEEWMEQTARRALDAIDGTLLPIRFVLHGHDSKFSASFQDTLRSAGIQPLKLPTRSPNLNAFAERRVRSIESDCLSKLILPGEASLRRAVIQFIEHHHLERLTKAKAITCSSLPPLPPASSRTPRRTAYVLSTRHMNILILRPFAAANGSVGC